MSERKYTISTGKSRRETKWKICSLTWPELVGRLKNTRRTNETVEEFKNMSKDSRDKIKDVGGFVGGPLTGGKRRKDAISTRSIVTLDVDYGDKEVWSDYCFELGEYASCMYSTHSHYEGHERFRLIIPLSRDVDTDEYQAISRKIAEIVGIEKFDISTYQPERLMYWPSTSKDGEFFFDETRGEPLNPEYILGMYHDWHDMSQWPMSEKDKRDILHERKEQGEPTEKPGAVGEFCRAYSISEAIDEFLSDVYIATDDPRRYTYAQGSSSCGLVVYDDKFAYSHHATDPAGQKLCNAFDLVRIHMFGNEDKNVREGTSITSTPSYKCMCEFANNSPKVVATRGEEAANRIDEMFGGIDFSEDIKDNDDKKSYKEWVKEERKKVYGKLDKEGKNNIPERTIKNIFFIFENDPEIKGNICKNEFSGKIDATRDLPWRSIKGYFKNEWTDADMSQLIALVESYGIKDCDQKVQHAFSNAASKHEYHPILDYLNKLEWDGVPRLDTLFIDWLGAEDSRINRVMTRKTFVAAVARVFQPGVKFDQVLALQGPEACGKSSILELLGKDWFSSMTIDMSGKEGMQQIQGSWIIEIPEFTGMKKSEVENVKAFVSRARDEYRASYGRTKEKHPRQCVLFTTTNEETFLKGDTGNRRFWVIRCMVNEQKKHPRFDMTEEDVDNIWAEAVSIYKSGKETLYLDEREDVASATEIQKECNINVNDPRIGYIQVFLDKKLPIDYNSMDYDLRRIYFGSDDKVENLGVQIRQTVCAEQILVECFGKKIGESSVYEVKEINSIMRSFPEWEDFKTTFKNYGYKRGFKRKRIIITKEDEDEFEI